MDAVNTKRAREISLVALSSSRCTPGWPDQTAGRAPARACDPAKTANLTGVSHPAYTETGIEHCP